MNKFETSVFNYIGCHMLMSVNELTFTDWHQENMSMSDRDEDELVDFYNKCRTVHQKQRELLDATLALSNCLESN